MAASDLTAARLRALLSYDCESGSFRWLRPRGKAASKPTAGSSDSGGYIKIGIAGHDYRAHRLAWLYVSGEWPKGQLDHMDGNPSNNAIANLRDVPQHVNQQNQRRPHADNAHGFMGVSRRKNCWLARINSNGVHHYLGVFRTAEAAHAAYLTAKRATQSGGTI